MVIYQNYRCQTMYCSVIDIAGWTEACLNRNTSEWKSLLFCLCYIELFRCIQN